MIVYKFYKEDCPPCYVLGRVLKTMDIPDDIQIININIGLEKNKQIVQDNKIEQVPTLLSDNGNRITGIKSKPDLEKFLGIN